MANQTEKQTVDSNPPKEQPARRPNETGTISVQAHMRIYLTQQPKKLTWRDEHDYSARTVQN
jgi:hypothetical protein